MLTSVFIGAYCTVSVPLDYINSLVDKTIYYACIGTATLCVHNKSYAYIGSWAGRQVGRCYSAGRQAGRQAARQAGRQLGRQLGR